MRRREFIAGLGGAAAWPIAARAERPAIPVVGFLNGQSPSASAHLVAAFRTGLNEIGYVEGQNLAIKYRWAEGQNDRLPGLAADLVRHSVSVISAAGSPISSLAAKAATTTIPIVFNFPGDPVKAGLVASLNRPGGNVTGVSGLGSLLEEKRFGLLHELTPATALIAVLVNPKNVNAETQVSDVQVAARTIGQQIILVTADSESDIDTAFATVVKERAGALIIANDTIRSSAAGRTSSSRSRHVMRCLLATRCVSMSSPVA
jgi:putative ABC transport system substrate-binding protein